MSGRDMADALGCDVEFVNGVMDSWSRHSLSTGPTGGTQGVQTCIRLAIAHALYATGGMTVQDAAAVSAGTGYSNIAETA